MLEVGYKASYFNNIQCARHPTRSPVFSRQKNKRSVQESSACASETFLSLSH
jgi:hypothetical protein